MEIDYLKAMKLYTALNGRKQFPSTKKGQKSIIEIFYNKLMTPDGLIEIDSPKDLHKDERIYSVAKRLYGEFAEKAISMIKVLNPDELPVLKTATKMNDYFRKVMNGPETLGEKEEKYIPQMESAIEKLAIIAEPLTDTNSSINNVVEQTIGYMTKRIGDFKRIQGEYPCVYPAGVPF